MALSYYAQMDFRFLKYFIIKALTTRLSTVLNDIDILARECKILISPYTITSDDGNKSKSN